MKFTSIQVSVEFRDQIRQLQEHAARLHREATGVHNPKVTPEDVLRPLVRQELENLQEMKK